MMMTRKDYIATAAILKDSKNYMTESAHQFVVSEFAKVMKADNPRFDFARFVSASGVNPL